MPKRIAVIQGHPDPNGQHLCHALGEGYVQGAQEQGIPIQVIPVALLKFPLLQSREDQKSKPPASIQEAQDIIVWANHLVIIFPLWLGTMPALLQGFFEQVLRPDYAYQTSTKSTRPRGLLAGRSARIVVTMGMPAFVYRWYYWEHGVRNLKRNILSFCGIKPVTETFMDMVDTSRPRNERWIASMRYMGSKGL